MVNHKTWRIILTLREKTSEKRTIESIRIGKKISKVLQSVFVNNSLHEYE